MAKLAIPHTTWNLSPLFHSDDDPTIIPKRQEVKDQTYQFINKWKDRTDYLKDPAVLKEALDEYNQWLEKYANGGDEFFYLHLRSAQEQNNPQLKAKLNQMIEFIQAMENDMQFFHLRLSRIDKKIQREFLAYPDLKPYHHHLKHGFALSPHLLSESE